MSPRSGNPDLNVFLAALECNMQFFLIDILTLKRLHSFLKAYWEAPSPSFRTGIWGPVGSSSPQTCCSTVFIRWDLILIVCQGQSSSSRKILEFLGRGLSWDYLNTGSQSDFFIRIRPVWPASILPHVIFYIAYLIRNELKLGCSLHFTNNLLPIIFYFL